MANLFNNSAFRKLFLTFHALAAILKVQIARSTINQALLRLPSVRNRLPRNSRLVEEQELIDLADRCMKLLMRRTSQPCLFQSYVRAVVLRHGGFPVDLNIGMRNMGSSSVYGHCWLTLEGVPYHEVETVESTYPFSLGRSATGIQYWAGSVDTKEMLRTKREE